MASTSEMASTSAERQSDSRNFRRDCDKRGYLRNSRCPGMRFQFASPATPIASYRRSRPADSAGGFAAKLDYLKALGVDAIWIAPCFPSPLVDFGYDVSDYENIDKMYGTLDDFDRLEKLGEEHGIKIILDFVVNHTSDQHPWFLES